MNEKIYIEDAQRLVRIAAPSILEKMNHEQVILAMTFFSFGMERLLKHLVARINPAFILKNSEFRNAAPCLYKKIFVATGKNEQIHSKPDFDVISFRVAMQRALLFSASANQNRQLLYALANYRDIVAHKPTSELDVIKANRLLARDGFSIIDEICTEISANVGDFFGKEYERLKSLSQKITNQEVFEKEFTSKLDNYKSLWEKEKSNQEFVSKASELTQRVLSESCESHSYEEFSCPACGQNAVARIEPDYDYDPVDQTSFLTGVFVDNIQCYHCGLVIDDYEELNYVDADSIFRDREYYV